MHPNPEQPDKEHPGRARGVMSVGTGVTAHSVFLRGLASRLSTPYVAGGAIAALLVGSAADGSSDEWSDIDLVLFYESWPGTKLLDSTRDALGGTQAVALGGDAAGDVYLEQFRVDGVACQLVHQTLDAWREASDDVLEKLDAQSPTQKALSGLHAGLVLHGDDVIERLRASSAYPEELRRAMVEANLDVFPLWRMQDALDRRDAELWQRGELVAGLQKVLGLLAGANATYFSTFQLKHAAMLAAAFGAAPEDLPARIDAALVAPMPAAAAELERLVDETLTIVERELPGADVSRLRRMVGGRAEPWVLPD